MDKALAEADIREFLLSRPSNAEQFLQATAVSFLRLSRSAPKSLFIQ
jgi:hypothetical protein